MLINFKVLQRELWQKHVIQHVTLTLNHMAQTQRLDHNFYYIVYDFTFTICWWYSNLPFEVYFLRSQRKTMGHSSATLPIADCACGKTSEMVGLNLLRLHALRWGMDLTFCFGRTIGLAMEVSMTSTLSYSDLLEINVLVQTIWVG